MQALSQSKELESPAFPATNSDAQELVGCWSLVSDHALFVWEKGTEMSENKSGFYFTAKGELIKRVATTWEGEVVQLHDYKGKWEFTSDETITLTYYFDEEQTVQERVKIIRFDSTAIEWRRQEWKEVPHSARD